MIKVKLENRDDNGCALSIDGDLTIYNATELRDALVNYIDNYNEVDLDLAKTKEIDSAGFQLLVQTKKELEEKGGRFTLVQPSLVVKEIIERYGMNEYFV